MGKWLLIICMIDREFLSQREHNLVNINDIRTILVIYEFHIYNRPNIIKLYFIWIDKSN